ncbi:RebB family R body protein [Chromobacterium paludis]|uniref:Uncharacterized protein n=1 Tax=Chromobacterium paludis TaxID=2605945 RepID=A0A5C1DIZ8_9NEIS|nr:RebB family R body protein [Chromobacterium paludis]QEL56533.1 hypothetical protein FYK34_13665 [Chromobacterium paludis]
MAIPAPVNGQVTDAVTQANVKVLGDAPAMAAGELYQQALHNRNLTRQNAADNSRQPNETDLAAGDREKLEALIRQLKSE